MAEMLYADSKSDTLFRTRQIYSKHVAVYSKCSTNVFAVSKMNVMFETLLQRRHNESCYLGYGHSAGNQQCVESYAVVKTVSLGLENQVDAVGEKKGRRGEAGLLTGFRNLALLSDPAVNSNALCRICLFMNVPQYVHS